MVSSKDNQAAQVNHLFAVLSILMMLIMSAACARGGDMVLELPDVQFFRVQNVGADPVVLEISGLAFHSALVVGGISEIQDGKKLQVLVHLEPASEGRSGSFDYKIAVPESVDTVVFGNSQALVWSREQAVLRR